MRWLILTVIACAPDPTDDSVGDTGSDCISGELSDHLGIPMAYICPGRFTMGSPEDELGRQVVEPQHEVRLTRGFYIGTQEVTWLQLEAFMELEINWYDDVGDLDHVAFRLSAFDAELAANAMSAAAGLSPCYTCTELNPGNPECVLDEAWETLYACPGYRLPTEAEWEYAARAGSQAAFATGGDLLPGSEYDCSGKLRLDDGSWLDHVAVYCNIMEEGDLWDGPERIRMPATKEPNAWGLYDMHGNVMEWVADHFASYEEGELVDPWVEGDYPVDYGRSIRGGSWFNSPCKLRSAARYWDSPYTRTPIYGFRLALSE